MLVGTAATAGWIRLRAAWKCFRRLPRVYLCKVECNKICIITTTLPASTFCLTVPFSILLPCRFPCPTFVFDLSSSLPAIIRRSRFVAIGSRFRALIYSTGEPHPRFLIILDCLAGLNPAHTSLLFLIFSAASKSKITTIIGGLLQPTAGSLHNGFGASHRRAIAPTKDTSRATVERTTSSSSSIERDGGFLSQRAQVAPDQPKEPAGNTVGTGEYANGYHFPPKYPMKEQFRMAVVWYWDFYNTGFGMFFTIYALNVIGWGFMLLLLLLSASPQMCWVDGEFNCDNINSQRRIWIEIDSQILTALFSATGFGLAPWRIRDLYLLLRYRINKDQTALRMLAGVHRHWFRLEGSEKLPPTLGPKNVEEATAPYDTSSVPYPLETMPDPPPTGVRAPPSELWKMDFIAWVNIWYIVFQAFLSAFMWGMSRYDRPPWTTGLFFGLTFITSSSAGIMEALQVMNVKAIEGVPLTKQDIARLARDKELGIPHYNNIKDKDPNEEEIKKAEKKAKRKNRFSLRSEKPASESTV